ncbi:MAG TPA: PAS domain S-box protein [Steroidobacteraceae bacterium]|nr:PAS domain S-box protein [Steroidobacteraceae bacterium]
MDQARDKPLRTVGEADASFRVFVESVRDYALLMLDPQGHVVSWNAGAEAIKGYTADEIIGKHFTVFYPREAIESGLPERELVVAQAVGRYEDEGWRLRKDGTRFWANVVITAMRDRAGNLMGFAKVTRDLTERRKSEEKLRASEQRFRVLVQGVRDYAIFMLDPAGHIATWNEGAQAIKGYAAHEIIGQHFSKFYPADALARGLPEHEMKTATTEGRFEDEGWRLRKDGTRFWANVVITAIRDPGGQLMGFTKITRDLTERRRHEQELRSSEEKFRMLVEGVVDYAIITLDRDGFITSWNTGAARLNGYAAPEILGRHFSRLYPTDEIAANKPWQDMINAREKGRFMEEGWRTRRDGTQYWANNVIAALHEGDGRSQSYYMVTQDLSQRRYAEGLADAAQRTHEFIAMLAHELRNPLAPIRNAVALMERKGLGDPVLESMRQTIDRQSLLLTRIVDELLDVNRIARGQFTVDRHAVDLRDILARAVESSRPLIDQRHQTLDIELPGAALIVNGDAMRLTQAFVNLLNNAAKYTHIGGSLGIRVEVEDGYITVRVADNGRGIPRESLESVFELFMQIDPESCGTQGGLGVGLALVRRIVELHGGRVVARSQGLNHGSEFAVTLPQLLAPASTREIETATTDAPKPRRMRVLVVDDNRDAADSMRMLLDASGQEARAVYDGVSALELAESFHPEVILLDIGMPSMDGYQVVRELRLRRLSPQPTVAALTGWGQDSDKKKAQDAGFDHHFTKPVGAEELLAFLDKVAAPRS